MIDSLRVQRVVEQGRGHVHICPNPRCGFAWAHGGLDSDPNVTYWEYERAHHCPRCGTDQHWRADPGERATCVFDGKKLTPLPRAVAQAGY